ncbi:hypothetical protein [Streptomyces sp. NBC_01591]|uniref:hypothetical protein n=1 Tax=Streptomyces sp. NBC_01591 TaxID=2975888 RepID=UPI003FA367BE
MALALREGWGHSIPYLKRILVDVWHADLTLDFDSVRPGSGLVVQEPADEPADEPAGELEAARHLPASRVGPVLIEQLTTRAGSFSPASGRGVGSSYARGRGVAPPLHQPLLPPGVSPGASCCGISCARLSGYRAFALVTMPVGAWSGC